MSQAARMKYDSRVPRTHRAYNNNFQRTQDHIGPTVDMADNLHWAPRAATLFCCSSCARGEPKCVWQITTHWLFPSSKLPMPLIHAAMHFSLDQSRCLGLFLQHTHTFRAAAQQSFIALRSSYKKWVSLVVIFLASINLREVIRGRLGNWNTFKQRISMFICKLR
jgi:hypothetical protein